ncbi:S8 family serine peptidase [Candidatus Colwellia aromaticivorans]|uniref:S8 family serine peptidase n=1 Tax=Candidatus Colwellia aromaticivorans TaxID=2267621 RepID=UPI000DF402DC|nr:S8 family serine peptidase [Candidatus Colwellia aromaticivorans]
MQSKIKITRTLALFAAISLPFLVLANADFKQGEVIVQGKVSEKDGFTVLRYYPNANITVVQVSPGKELKKVKNLRQKGKSAHVNVSVSKSSVPNDPLISVQWQWANINAEQAWQLNTGANTTVAVLDTGIASAPSDGVNCLTLPHNVYNTSAFPEDGDGHGTHVSGTIAQTANNNVGAVGLAFDACVMPVKVLDDSGSGGMAEIAEGIYYAVNNGAHVINMSLGTNARYNITSDPVLDVALDYAYSEGVVVVAASGNDGNRKNLSYPASYPSVISVGATDYNNSVTSYSNKSNLLDIVAPGGDMNADRNGDGLGDGILQETRVDGTWGYYLFQGTSMASPHVAALSAMLISHRTATTPDEVKQALTESATDLYSSGHDKTSGYGLINSIDALNWQQGVTTPPPPGDGCTDNDGDGVCYENGDCDDNNSSIFPGANDRRGKKGRDNIDNDCNGIIDG